MTCAVTAELFTLTANTRKAETLEVSVKGWRRPVLELTASSPPRDGGFCTDWTAGDEIERVCSYNSSAWRIK